MTQIIVESFTGFHCLGSHYGRGEVFGTIDGKPFKAKYIEEGTLDDRYIFTHDRAWIEGEEVKDFPFGDVKAQVWTILDRSS